MNKIDLTISKEVYERLVKHRKGFETPNDVIKKLLISYESNFDSIDIESDPVEQPLKLDINYFPEGEEAFKKEFLKTKKAIVSMTDITGNTVQKLWESPNFKETSSVSGNLRSGYLRKWKEKGIVKVEVAID